MFFLYTQRPHVVRAQEHGNCPMDRHRCVIGLMCTGCQRLLGRTTIVCKPQMLFMVDLVIFFLFVP